MVITLVFWLFLACCAFAIWTLHLWERALHRHEEALRRYSRSLKKFEESLTEQGRLLDIAQGELRTATNTLARQADPAWTEERERKLTEARRN